MFLLRRAIEFRDTHHTRTPACARASVHTGAWAPTGAAHGTHAPHAAMPLTSGSRVANERA